MADGHIPAHYITTREILPGGSTGELTVNLNDYEKNANFLIISVGSEGMADAFVIDNQMNYYSTSYNRYIGTRDVKYKLNSDHSVIYFNFTDFSAYARCMAVKM